MLTITSATSAEGLKGPSSRSLRIPSAQQSYSCSSQQRLRVPSMQSPSVPRRRSQHTGKSSKTNLHAQNDSIVNEIVNLKNQYSALTQGYKLLLQQRARHIELLSQLTQENTQVKLENERLKQKLTEYELGRDNIQQISSRDGPTSIKDGICLKEYPSINTKAIAYSISRLGPNNGHVSNQLYYPTSNVDTNGNGYYNDELSDESQLPEVPEGQGASDGQVVHDSLPLAGMVSGDLNLLLNKTKSRSQKQQVGFKKLRKDMQPKLEINLECIKPKQHSSYCPKTPLVLDKKVKHKSGSKRREDKENNSQVKQHTKRKFK